jgi:hypothetical protein
VQEVLLLDGKDRKVAKTAIEDCRPTGVQWKESESTGLACIEFDCVTVCVAACRCRKLQRVFEEGAARHQMRGDFLMSIQVGKQ